MQRPAPQRRTTRAASVPRPTRLVRALSLVCAAAAAYGGEKLRERERIRKIYAYILRFHDGPWWVDGAEWSWTSGMAHFLLCLSGTWGNGVRGRRNVPVPASPYGDQIWTLTDEFPAGNQGSDPVAIPTWVTYTGSRSAMRPTGQPQLNHFTTLPRPISSVIIFPVEKKKSTIR